MTKLKKNQSGFGALEVLLIIVIIAVIAGLGWFVINSRNKTNTSYENAANNNTVTKPDINKSKTTTNTTTTSKTTSTNSGCKTYTSADRSFSFICPKSWVTASNPELCSENIALIAPTKATVGTCGSENFGEVAILSTSESCELLGSNFSNKTESTVTVSNISGKKYYGIDKTNDLAITRYCFKTSKLTYQATYYKTSTEPDVLSDFNSLVKTLKFNK
ncbi:MAG: hypothetical protein ACXWLH_02050 [Candidatus Saccharimonadales bacterium]